MSGFLKKCHEKIMLHLPIEDEGGFLGALAAIGFTILLLTVIMFIFSHVFPLIVETIARSASLSILLTEVPVMAGAPIVGGEVSTSHWIGTASNVMGDLYLDLRLVSLVIVMIGSVFIGISYAFEQFNLMRRGTAEQILSEIGLIVILIFLFPTLYNAAAVMVNGVNHEIIMNYTVKEGDEIQIGGMITTYHAGPDVVDHGEMAEELGSASGVVPGLLISGGFFSGLDFTKGFVAIVSMTVSLMAIVTAIAIGVFRVLATVTLAAAFPLVLAIRLIPPLRSVASRLTSALIGIVLATVVMALFIRVAWQILSVSEVADWTIWLIAVGTLIALSAAFTITAPALSGMAGAFGGTIGRGVGFTAGGMIAGGATAAIAGPLGAGGALLRTGRMGGKMGGPKLTGRERAGVIGRAFLQSLSGGARAKEPIGAMIEGLEKTRAESKRDIIGRLADKYGIGGSPEGARQVTGGFIEKSMGDYDRETKGFMGSSEFRENGSQILNSLKEPGMMGKDEKGALLAKMRMPGISDRRAETLGEAYGVNMSDSEMSAGILETLIGDKETVNGFRSGRISTDDLGDNVMKKASLVNDVHKGAFTPKLTDTKGNVVRHPHRTVKRAD